MYTYWWIIHGLYHILSCAWLPQVAMHNNRNMVQPMYYSPVVHSKTVTCTNQIFCTHIIFILIHCIEVCHNRLLLTEIFTRSVNPFPNNKPFVKIGKSNKLFMQDCSIPMCASCENHLKGHTEITGWQAPSIFIKSEIFAFL